MKTDSLMLLCKVVDNFGDIGVVYRLAKAISDFRPSLKLTLVVSNLHSFKLMAREIDESKDFQIFKYKDSVWQVVKWDLQDFSVSKENIVSFKNENTALNLQDFDFILETFQCGRPDWLENVLFSENFTKTVQILQIDYLTAEEWADDFHLLRSGTRKTSIKKVFFMPGFTKKTAGLIQGGRSLSLAPAGKPSSATLSAGQIPATPFRSQALTSTPFQIDKSAFNISFFAYERNCKPIVQALEDFQKKLQETNPDFYICVYAASGRSWKPFKQAYDEKSASFKLVELPFLQQEEWDFLLTQMDFNFVRGEDSLSRAALCGKPYIWHAYIQDEDYQLVKVDALLSRMKQFFSEEDFSALKTLWDNYNKSTVENFTSVEKARIIPNERDAKACEEGIKSLLLKSVQKAGNFCSSFRNYTKSLAEIGNFEEHLLNYIDKVEL